MKLSEIKTKTEFYEMADIWYQRAHKLREVWQNEIGTERGLRAYYIWLKLYERLQYCIHIAMKFSQPKLPVKYKTGGLNIVSDHNDSAFVRGEAVIEVKLKFK